MKRKFNKVYLLISFFIFSTLLYAGRPLTTDDAETVEKGKLELEIGYDFIQNNDDTKNQEIGISLKIGLTNWMDLGISVPFIIEESDTKMNKWGKIEIGAKFSVLKESEKRPGISLTISGTPNSKEGDTRYTINSILSKNFGKPTFHLNLGTYSLKTPGENEYLFTYSTALEYAFSERLNLCGEIVGEHNSEDPLELLIGLNYSFSENLKFGFGFAFGLNDASNDWRITTGFTFNW